MQRLGVIGVVGVVTLACAACGGSRHSSGPPLPALLVQQIKAAILKPSVIGGASSATTADVYGPASHTVIEKASSPGFVSGSPHVPGAWYLIVLHGHFVCNCPIPPPGGNEPHGGVATIIWSPSKGAAGESFSVGRPPSTVSRLPGPVVIDLG